MLHSFRCKVGATMLKSRNEFATAAEYKRYTRSPEFMKTYKVFGKSATEIQQEMCFPENWMNFLEAAVKFVHEQPDGQSYTAFNMFELVDEVMEYYLKG